MKTWIKKYTKNQSKICLEFPIDEIEKWIDILDLCRIRGKRIFVCGNGGSAANAIHFSTDLGKGTSDVFDLEKTPRFKIISLNENGPWITALGNDLSYDNIFVEQLKNHATEEDILISISVSGNSPNIIKTVEWAKSNGLLTLSLTNCKDNTLKNLSDRTISINDIHFGRVEDAHMNILHIIAYSFIERKWKE